MSGITRDDRPQSATRPAKKSFPSQQELNALRAVAKHGTIKSAAQALTLSPHTIDAHLDRLRCKSRLRHLPQLIAWAATNGWLQEIADFLEK